MQRHYKNSLTILIEISIIIAVGIFFCIFTKHQLLASYHSLQSTVLTDRYGQTLAISKNFRGFYLLPYEKPLPPNIEKMLLTQEDQQFYRHLGINPWSMFRAAIRTVHGNGNPGSSTITQQLVKILRGHENNRSWKNKLTETADAIALELTTSKHDILRMYADVAYFGNSVSGIALASELYAGTSPDRLETADAARIIATLSSPSARHPFSPTNPAYAKKLLGRTGDSTPVKPLSESTQRERSERFQTVLTAPASFEITSLAKSCQTPCQTTIDKKLTDTIRDIVTKQLARLNDKKVHNAAVVVLRIPTNELLAIVGTPDPTDISNGRQINMATQYRPVGSTLKPLIYAKAFEKGARPYTLVDDREYRYTIGSGFSLYPKNYDYTYHGIVTLHEALDNSFNVPAVKVLEFAGSNVIADLLEQVLHIPSAQPAASYELGLALGAYETDLLHLSSILSIFPNQGHYRPITWLQHQPSHSTQVIDPRMVALVNKILNDRVAGSEEFGQKSVLNLPADNYAVKTGTSREYHDSWTIGYTPDFLVGVWVGNSDNTAMDAISGQLGAGLVWHDTMSYLLNSPYNRHTPFDFSVVTPHMIDGKTEYGLATDNISLAKNILLSGEIITSPHDGDVILWEKNLTVPLTATESVSWLANNKTVSEPPFRPATPGTYDITATTKDGKKQTIQIEIRPDRS